MKLKKLWQSIFAVVASVCLAVGIGSLVAKPVESVQADDTVTFTDVDVTRSFYFDNRVQANDTYAEFFLRVSGTAMGGYYNPNTTEVKSTRWVLNASTVEQLQANGSDILSYFAINGKTVREIINTVDADKYNGMVGADNAFKDYDPVMVNAEGSFVTGGYGFHFIIAKQYLKDTNTVNADSIDGFTLTVKNGFTWYNVDKQAIKVSADVTYGYDATNNRFAQQFNDEVDITKSMAVRCWGSTEASDSTNPNYTFIIDLGASNNILPWANNGAGYCLNDHPTTNGCDLMSYIQINGVDIRTVVGAAGANSAYQTSAGLPANGGFRPISCQVYKSGTTMNIIEIKVTKEYLTEVNNGTIEGLEITIKEGIAWANTEGKMLKTTQTITYKVTDPAMYKYLEKDFETVDVTNLLKYNSTEDKGNYYEVYFHMTGATFAPWVKEYYESRAGHGEQMYLNDNASTNGCDLMQYVYVDGVNTRSLTTSSAYTTTIMHNINSFKPIVVMADGYWGGIRMGISKEYLNKNHNGALDGLTITLKTGFAWDNIDNKKVVTTEDITWKYVGDKFVDSWIEAASITCEDSLELNFYAEARDSVKELTGTIGETEVKGVYNEKHGLIKFTYPVAAKDYETEITLTLANGTSQTTSVKAYLASIPESNGAYAVAQAITSYCEAANAYFAGETVTATDALTANLDAYKASIAGEQAGVNVYGATLELEDKTNIRIYFTATDMEGVVCKVGETEVTAKEWKDGYYVIVIEDITATDLDAMYTITVGGITVNYGALSYVEATHDGANVALANVVKALYAYSVAAEAYFAANNN